MNSLRLPAIIVAFLLIAVSIPPSLFSQPALRPSRPKHPASRQRQPKRPHRADDLAPAINDLLKLNPLDPESPDEKYSGNENASSEEEIKPPADDAPIKDLIAYWADRNDPAGPNAPQPSDKVRRRLLEAIEDRPEFAVSLINFLPETTDMHDRLYKLLEEEPEEENHWKTSLRNWLQRNSRHFRDDMIAAAREDVENVASSGHNLRALARLDWETARPIIETTASGGNAQMAAVALSLLYERAQRDGDSAQVERLRASLKAIVVNRQKLQDARQTALISLMATEWNGQEEWVVSLFADPTLNDLPEDDANTKDEPGSIAKITEPEIPVITKVTSFLSPGSGILFQTLDLSSEKWFTVVSDLVGHNHRTVHKSAVRCLVTFLSDETHDKKKKQDAAQRLAPWLTEPGWAAADDRSDFILSLVDLQAPELLSGLIWVLEHDENLKNRAAAANSLTKYRDPRAIQPLRRALENDTVEDHRDKIVTALAECGGFSDDEMAAAIEAYAKVVVTKEGEEEISLAQAGGSGKPLPLNVSIGRILHESETIQATEGMALRLFERAKALRASQPAVARQILRSIEGVPLRVAEVNLVDRIGAGWADVDTLTLALENCDSLRKSVGDELYGLIKQGGYAAGIAAAILNDEREHREALKGTDAKAQLALLAGARYLRDKLPIELASKLLDSRNRALAKAAESYLEVEDGAEARKLILARRRGEAYILGDITANGRGIADDWEEAMRKEIKSGAGLETIYALGQPGSHEGFKGVIIRVRGGKAEISIYDVEGRRNARSLTESEFEELKSFTSRQEVEDLGPESYAEAGSLVYEYLRLTKDGGRRIKLDGLRRAPKNPTLHEELSGLFYRLSRSGEFTPRYAIQDKIPGVEVLLADKKQEAMMVCGEGREIRVLIWEKGSEYRRSIAEAIPEWREFSSGKPGKVTDDPSACRVLSMIPTSMKNRWSDHYREISLPTRSGDAWVYVSYGEDPGVWKLGPGAEWTKIVSGSYSSPILTPDGKWLVAMKTMSEAGDDSLQVIRHNLQTGKEFPINIANGGSHPPGAYVAAHGKVLLGVIDPHRELLPGPMNYLLDVETGTVQQVKGEFRPLAERFGRELQPTENPNEFWAVVHDWNKRVTRFGRYDSKNFAFTTLIELPGLILGNSDFWVDVNAGKIWFTYKGHLLRLPLPK
jgi:HEAT repeats